MIKMVADPELQTITDIIVHCAKLVDSGHASRVADYFTEDGILEFGQYAPNAGVTRGRDAIADFFLIREKNTAMVTRHLVSNVAVTFDGESTARSEYVMTVYRGGKQGGLPDVMFVADVQESYLKRPDGNWAIKSRLVDPVYVMSYD